MMTGNELIDVRTNYNLREMKDYFFKNYRNPSHRISKPPKEESTSSFLSAWRRKQQLSSTEPKLKITDKDKYKPEVNSLNNQHDDSGHSAIVATH